MACISSIGRRTGGWVLLVIALVVGSISPASAELPRDLLAMRATLHRAMDTPLSGTGPILADATIEDFEWDSNILSVYLAVDADASTWAVEPVEVEAASDAINGSFLSWDDFGGSAIYIRVGDATEYKPLASYIRYKSAGPVEVAAVGDVLNAPTSGQSNGRTGDLRGAFTNAARQPVGALTGITVFASCGHGWTADTSTNGAPWILQRPVTLGMNEDHGNLDQLNYFVQYAYNAGATVVPFRPVGWQPIEIVIDNADPEVVYTGSWSVNSTNSKYYGSDSGDRYRFTPTSATETATARFVPNITTTDFYPVYCFVISSDNRAVQTYRIKHSGGVSEVAVDHRMVGNGWVWLGDYYLVAGDENWVEITNESTDGDNVIADAIRWGCGMGDIVRPGPNTISGYSRDEECQRYWAHSELGNHANGFTAADIWDSSSSDQNDNVSTGARFAREMNQQTYNNDRWRRVHLEFHTNAYAGTSRGCIALVNSIAPTTNQTTYATFMSNEIDLDLPLIDSQFEHEWVERPSATLSGEYGAISANANGNEFDATLIELAFHDNEEDAELLRDDRVRAAMARSSVHGIIKFLNWLSAGQVPLDFAPDTPRNFQAIDAGAGDVALSWQPPVSGEAYGEPATGYVVYTSTNGYGFGNPVVLGNVLTTTISGLPAGETRYYRIAATNDGGESPPSEVLAVRRPESGVASVLIVNGFDRLRRDQNPTNTIPQGTFERQIWRSSNSYDYVVQHAEALAANTTGFSSVSNEAVHDGEVSLEDYSIVMWICGEESVEDATLDAQERAAVEAFLVNGGALLLSGADIAYDLDNQGDAASQAFYQTKLKATFGSTDANSYIVQGVSGTIFEGIGQISFSPASGAPYDADHPDQIAAATGGKSALTYVGGSGGTAAVQFDSGSYRAVTLAFPFETIGSPADRAEVMRRVLGYLGTEPVPFDFNNDGRLTKADLPTFVFCLNQSGVNKHYVASICQVHDPDQDGDVDLSEFMLFQQAYDGVE